MSNNLAVDGVVYRGSGVLIIDKYTVNKKYDQRPNKFSESVMKDINVPSEIVSWGRNNQLPQSIIEDMDECGVLNAGVDTKARIAMGKGPMPARVVGINKDGIEELEFVQNNEIFDFLEENRIYENHYAGLKDLIGQGNRASQILLSNDRSKIVGLKRADIAECRKSKMNGYGVSEYMYKSADWMRHNRPESDGVTKIPLLHPDFPLRDLQSRRKGNEFAVWHQYPLFGRKYYAMPLWWPAYKWVQIAKAIPEMKEAMFRNQMTIKYHITIHAGFWERQYPGWKKFTEKKQLETQEDFYDKVEEHLVGGKNAYKSLFTARWLDGEGKEVEGVKITEIDDKVKEGKLLLDSAAGTSEILFCLQINPALFGANMPGGAYQSSGGGGSNIREAYLVQVMLMEPERRYDSDILNLVRRYNNWLPGERIVWRYPNQILTTLDTGKNTEGVA